jgi:hypothetical protein
MPNFQKAAIEQYLCTGEHDALFRAWAGETFTARARQGDLALRAALIALVKSRTGRALVPEELANLDVVSFTRTKVGPMVRGFFPKAEQQPILDVLARSVVFLTAASLSSVAALRRGASYYHVSRRTSRCQMIGSLRASTSTPSAPQSAPEMDGRKFCRTANFLRGDGPLRRTGRHDVKRSPSNAGCNSRNIS